MIYETVDLSDPIRQGDIFFNVPRVDFSSQKIQYWMKIQPQG